MYLCMYMYSKERNLNEYKLILVKVNVFSMSQLLNGLILKKLHVVYLKFKFNCVLYFLCAKFDTLI